MDFTITEQNGTEPIDSWLVAGIKSHAKSKFGIILSVEIKKEDPKDDEKPLK